MGRAGEGQDSRDDASMSGWGDNVLREVIREVIEARARERMAREEDMKIFDMITAASGWVTRLRAGDTVWLTKLEKWATVVSTWDDGKIKLAYDASIHEWHVSATGRGLDGNLIMREYTLGRDFDARDRELDLGEVNLSEVRSMVMVDVGKEWKDVVTLLRDPMDVDGVEVGGTIWSASGHSGDEEVGLRLVYDAPSMECTGNPGEKFRINAKLSLLMTLSNSDSYNKSWDIGSFVKDYEVSAFKATSTGVMIVLCHEDLMTARLDRTWGILTDLGEPAIPVNPRGDALE